MIDGISIELEIYHFLNWRQNLPFEIQTPINTDTGEIMSRERIDNSKNVMLLKSKYQTIIHKGRFETYNIIIREVVRADSINKFKGENYQRFNINDVKAEIDKLCDNLNIDSRNAKIDSLEFGVNLKVDFTPHIFLNQNLIGYKTHQFNQYAPDNKNQRLGYECFLSQYSIKCYDKGLQFGLPYNLMRFELKFKKMQKLNKLGIKVLSDLTKPANLRELKYLLLQAWEDILLYEHLETGNNKLSLLEKNLIIRGNNPKYWTELNSISIRRFHYHRKVFKDMLSKCGMDYHREIFSKIDNEWQELIEPAL